MRRGFLNSPHAKRVIEEVYAPQSPPMPRSSSQGKPSSSRRTRDVDEKAAATGDAISMDVDVDVDVEMAMIEDVYVLPPVPAVASPVRDSNRVAGIDPTERIASSQGTRRRGLPRAARQSCPRSMMAITSTLCPTLTVSRLDPHTLS